MTPAGIEPATFRFVAQHLNHCATAVPDQISVSSINNEIQQTRIQKGGGGLGGGVQPPTQIEVF